MTEGQARYVRGIYETRLGLPPVVAAAKPRSLRTSKELGAPPRRGWRLTPEKRNKRINRLDDDFLPLEMRHGHVASYIVVLTVVVIELLRHGRCELFSDAIGAFGGYERTSVRNALREAERSIDGRPPLIQIERRRAPNRRKNDSNVITVVDPSLKDWLKRKAAKMRGITRRFRLYFGLPLPPKASNFSESTGLSDKNKGGVALKRDNIPRSAAPTAPDSAAGGWIARPAPA